MFAGVGPVRAGADAIDFVPSGREKDDPLTIQEDGRCLPDAFRPGPDGPRRWPDGPGQERRSGPSGGENVFSLSIFCPGKVWESTPKQVLRGGREAEFLFHCRTISPSAWSGDVKRGSDGTEELFPLAPNLAPKFPDFFSVFYNYKIK